MIKQKITLNITYGSEFQKQIHEARIDLFLETFGKLIVSDPNAAQGLNPQAFHKDNSFSMTKKDL